MVVPDGGDLNDYLYDAARDNITENTIQDVVLKERRIELAFEGHRIFDLMRNGKDLVRNYWVITSTAITGYLSAVNLDWTPPVLSFMPGSFNDLSYTVE